MEALDALSAWLLAAISENLALGVFAASLVETIVPPVPTLLVLPAAGYAASQAGLDPAGAAALGVPGGAGATVSAMALYAASRRLGRAAVLRYLRRAGVREARLARAEAWFGRHGPKAVLLGRMVPVFRELVSIPAGLLRMRVVAFAACTFAGSVAWCTALIMAGYYLGAALGGSGA